MKNTLIAIIIALVATVAFFGGKLSNTTNGSHTEEPQSAVTDTVKADTVSFEDRIKLAIKAHAELASHKYKNWNEFHEHEIASGTLEHEDESRKSWVLPDDYAITNVTTHKNGMPEFVVRWTKWSDGSINRSEIMYMDENGNEVAWYNPELPRRWFCDKMTYNKTELHKYSGGSVKLKTGLGLVVSDPRVCFNIK